MSRLGRTGAALAATIAMSGPAGLRAEPGPEEAEPLDRVPAIIGGQPTTGDPAVAALLAVDDDGQLFAICSGTLITPTILLTAAHCVDVPEAAGFVIYVGADLTVEEDPSYQFVAAASRVAFHPQWNPDDIAAGYDIGIAELAEPAPVAPREVNLDPITSSQVGQPIRLVGWGVTAGGAEDSGVKRAVVSQLADFDDKLLLVGDSERSICNGDSGGPGFMTIGGREVLVGIASFVDAGCSEIGVSTRVDVYRDFLADQAGVGDSPPAQPDAGPGGDDPDGDLPLRPTPADEGGCSAAGGAGSAPLVLAVLLLVVATRRKR